MNSKERWAAIQGFPNYLVSNLGRIKNVKFNRVLNPSLSKKNGYLRVNLCSDNKCVTKLVHKLVVDGFIGEIPNGLEINHIDGIKTNCKIENLELVTPSENVRHAFKIGLRRPTYKKVMCVENGKIFKSLKEAAEKMGVNRTHVSMVISGKAPSAKGYHFEIVD